MALKKIYVISLLTLLNLNPACGTVNQEAHAKQKNKIKTVSSEEIKKMSKKETVRETTFIPVKAVPGKETELEAFLKGGAPLVEATEPMTLQWLALKQENGAMAIIDFFASDTGRKAHFAGKVAEALNQNAPGLVEGGWDNGVVKNIENAKVLSSVIRGIGNHQATLATRITLKAKAGKQEELAAFLTGGADIVRETEAKTLLWYAIRISDDTFAIFDVFANEAGRAAHFAGKVAKALRENADALVEGGWGEGVLKNVQHFDIISGTYR